MEIRHLRYFVAVAEALSFRGAAERLHVSQPTLSKQIRDLEDELGGRLFDRDTARVRLTVAGAELLPEARAIVAQAARLELVVREATQGRRGKLTIGNVGSLSAGFLPASLTSFHDRYPDVEVSLVELRFREQRAALLGGRIDVGLIGGPTPPEGDDFEHVLVLRSPQRAFLPSRHPLARRTRLTLRDLTGEKMLAVTAEPGSGGHAEILRSLFQRRGLPPPAAKPVDSLDSLLALIASDQGISILPALMAARRNLGLTTRALALDGADGEFSLWGVWRRDEKSRLVQNFITLLRAQTAGIGVGARR